MTGPQEQKLQTLLQGVRANPLYDVQDAAAAVAESYESARRRMSTRVDPEIQAATTNPDAPLSATETFARAIEKRRAALERDAAALGEAALLIQQKREAYQALGPEPTRPTPPESDLGNDYRLYQNQLDAYNAAMAERETTCSNLYDALDTGMTQAATEIAERNEITVALPPVDSSPPPLDHTPPQGSVPGAVNGGTDFGIRRGEFVGLEPVPQGTLISTLPPNPIPVPITIGCPGPEPVTIGCPGPEPWPPVDPTPIDPRPFDPTPFDPTPYDPPRSGPLPPWLEQTPWTETPYPATPTATSDGSLVGGSATGTSGLGSASGGASPGVGGGGSAAGGVAGMGTMAAGVVGSRNRPAGGPGRAVGVVGAAAAAAPAFGGRSVPTAPVVGATSATPTSGAMMPMTGGAGGGSGASSGGRGTPATRGAGGAAAASTGQRGAGSSAASQAGRRGVVAAPAGTSREETTPDRERSLLVEDEWLEGEDNAGNGVLS